MSIYYSSPCSKSELSFLSLPGRVKKVFYTVAKPRSFFAATALRNGSIGHDHFDMRQFIATRSIFIHIPKSAGRSVRKSLYNGITCSHATSYWYRLALSDEEIKDFFIYTLVRNPWDRLHSAYYFLKKGGSHQGDRRNWDKYLSKYSSFADFILDLPISIEFLRKHVVHLQPMHHFIEIFRGINILDYFGYYEDLPNAYSYIRKHIPLASPKACMLSHENKNSLKPHSYQDEYSDRMIEIVGSIYQRDISLFGYTFDSFSRKESKIRLASYYKVP